MGTEKLILTLLALFGVVHGNFFTNFNENSAHCTLHGTMCPPTDGNGNTDETICSATWGGFPRLNNETSEMIVHHLQTSIHYLLISSNFKYWKHERPGFANYFSKLSDDHWEDALSLLVHFAERGGEIDRDTFKVEGKSGVGVGSLHLSELQSLSYALDTEKWLAQRTLRLAHEAIHHNHEKCKETTTSSLTPLSPQDLSRKNNFCAHDFELVDFLADGLQKHSVLRIKHLANNFNLLKQILHEGNNVQYAVFKFDSDYLK